MALTGLTTLLPRILPRLTGGCPTPLAEQVLRTAAAEFTNDTEIWRETLEAVTSVAGQSQYALPLPTVTVAPEGEGEPQEVAVEAIVKRVLAVRIDGRTMTEGTYGFSLAGQLVLARDPGAGKSIVADVVLVAQRSAASLPDWLVREWGYGIEQKTVALLKGQPRLGCADPDGAKIAEMAYLSACSDAKARILNGGLGFGMRYTIEGVTCR